MLEILGIGKPFSTNDKRIRIDNLLFFLHYRITSIALFIFSIIISCNYFWGQHISCFTSLTEESEIFTEVLNAYCYVQSTYTLPGHHDKAIAPGVYPGKKAHNDDAVIHHKYYQWMPIFLFFEGILFYLPRYIWKSLEHGQLRNLILSLNKLDRHNNEDDVKSLAQHLDNEKGSYKWYAVNYFLCEILNLVHVVGQLFFINSFLGGSYVSLGTHILEYLKHEQSERDDPLIRVFPRITKCMLGVYGPSGDMQSHDSFCVLPVNLLNEKIFIILWFWLILLCVLGFLCVFYHIGIVSLLCPIRNYILVHSHRTNKNKLWNLLKGSDVGFWLILKRLSENIDPSHFKTLVNTMKKSELDASNAQKNFTSECTPMVKLNAEEERKDSIYV